MLMGACFSHFADTQRQYTLHLLRSSHSSNRRITIKSARTYMLRHPNAPGIPRQQASAVFVASALFFFTQLVVLLTGRASSLRAPCFSVAVADSPPRELLLRAR